MQEYIEIYQQQLKDNNDDLFFRKVISSFYFSEANSQVACIKDTCSRYVAVSEQFSKLAGQSVRHIIGKSAAELFLCSGELAQTYYQQDREVETSREKRKFLDINYYSSGLGILIFQKTPIINPATDNVLGVYCIASTFEGASALNVVQLLAKEPLENQCNPDGCMKSLTKREQEVLFCVANGLTDRKLIARFLSAIHGKEIGADATIKNILKSLYNKIPCGSSISSLANYAMIRKCHTFIPESIMTAECLVKGISIPFD